MWRALMLAWVAGCSGDPKDPGKKEDSDAPPDETSAPDSDTPEDTSWWECAEDGILDASTACSEHLLYTCESASVGMRRGDALCWPAIAFCPDQTWCDTTSPGWTDLPLDYPADHLAVAEGVLEDPAEIFSSPIDDGFVPTGTIEVANPSEAANVFWYGEAGPGDEVVIANGTYSDCYIGFYADGADGAPITLRAETPGGVILEGCSIYMEGSWLIVRDLDMRGTMTYAPLAIGDYSVECDHCAARNMSIDMQPEGPMSNPYIEMVGHDSEVSDSTFVNKANTSAVIVVDRLDLTRPTAARIYRNTFADRTDDLGGGATNGFEVIQLGWSMDYFYPSYSVIEGNLFERCDGESEIIANKSSNNSIRFNTFRDSAGQISMRDGFQGVVEGNYILGEGKAGSSGVRVAGAGAIVLNNHIEDVNAAGSLWSYPLILVTGTDDHYEEYTPTFDSALIFNRVVSPLYAMALDTEDYYGPPQYAPHDNLYAWNLLYTGGGEPLAWMFDDSVDANTMHDNWVDTAVSPAGFDLHTEAATSSGGLSGVSEYEAALGGVSAADLLTGTPMAWGIDRVVLPDNALYDHVPVLVEGDVGASF